MNDTYVECLVKGKASGSAKFGTIILGILTVVFALLMLLIPASLILAVITGVGAYFLNQGVEVEYEYLYLNKEISIDKIIGQSRRKKVGEYSVDRIEVFAPVKSWHLDSFRNRQVKVTDYSNGEEEGCYALYYEGGKMLLLTPTEEFVKAVMSVAPRKVFKD